MKQMAFQIATFLHFTERRHPNLLNSNISLVFLSYDIVTAAAAADVAECRALELASKQANKWEQRQLCIRKCRVQKCSLVLVVQLVKCKQASASDTHSVLYIFFIATL